MNMIGSEILEQDLLVRNFIGGMLQPYEPFIAAVLQHPHAPAPFSRATVLQLSRKLHKAVTIL
ncbi:MAG TPA: hypothetical protein VFH52_04445 [Rhodanobacteraceae bacterium]|nr:hypothetical protein [Rhodanobacteraceae bacterium]